MKIKMYLVILLLLPFCAVAQIIPLTNPSFEDIGGHSHVPRGWYDCGFPGESPPDTQPDPASTFQVTMLPQDGNTYLGLVVRDNDTWESVAQKLPEPLQSDSCYTFFLYVARSATYVSMSRTTELQANYDTPAVLQIYGGYDYCDRGELLATSDLIVNTRWEEIKLVFSPGKNYTHLLIAAFYKAPVLFPYNGNVLVDNIQLEKGCGETPTEKTEETIIEAPVVAQAKSEEVQPREKKQPIDLPSSLPGTLEELENNIAKYGKYIHYDNNETSLETFDFTFDNKEYKNTNLYLAFIAKAMQQFPDYRLLISVDGKGYARYTRTINIENQLLDLGLDKEHFTVYPHNELDARKEWLWVAADNDLLMQIIPIQK